MSKRFTVVRATCPECGDVAIASLMVTVVMVNGDPKVAFTCPGCIETLRIPVNTEIAKRLVAAGAASAVQWDLPPISDREVEHFCISLNTIDDLAGIAESEPRAH